MRINSNIAGVLRHIEAFERGLPAALAETVKPERWMTPLRHAAEGALEAVAEPEERPFIPLFLAGIEGAVTAKGMAFEMTAPVFSRNDPAAAKMAAAQNIVEGLDRRQYGDTSRRRRTPGQPSPMDALALEDIRLAIREWVQAEKIKTDQDAGLSDDEIADRLAWIMGVAPGSQRDRTPAMDDAAAGLMRHVVEFMQQGNGGQLLMSERTVRVWLDAVLIAWRETLERMLPQAVSLQIDKLWRTTRDRLV